MEIIFLILLCYFLFTIRKFARRSWRFKRKYRDPYFAYQFGETQHADLSNTQIALGYVQKSEYATRKIMNFGEYSVFRIAENYFKNLKGNYRVIPQVCLGAVLECNYHPAGEEKLAHGAINSKRIDVGVINSFGHLVLAIEYNGEAHYQGNTVGRDAVKRLALSKVNVPMVEIIPEDLKQERVVDKIKIFFPKE